MDPSKPACRACGATDLVKAHIVPAAFGRLARGDGKHLREVSRDRQRRYNSPPWDARILCAACDGRLGRYDKAAIEFFRIAAITEPSHGTEMLDIPAADTASLVKFVMAVLWRASITSLPAFDEVRLGPYENRFRGALFEPADASQPLPAEVVLFRYTSPSLDPTGFFTMPIWATLNGLNCYVFGLAGFRVVAKVDRRRFPAVYAPFVVNRSDRVRAPIVALEDTGEFEAMAAVMRDRLWKARVIRRGVSALIGATRA